MRIEHWPLRSGSTAISWTILGDKGVLAGIDDPEAQLNRSNLDGDEGSFHLVVLDSFLVRPLPKFDSPGAQTGV